MLVTFNTKNRVTVKPSSEEVKEISKNLTSIVDCSIERLVDGISKGYCFSPAVFNGTRSNDNFISQQIFALDFDNGVSIDTVVKQLELYSIVPNIIYTTFSDSIEKRKFRVIIALNTKVTDKPTRDSIQKTLMKICSDCDKACKDSARLFYPSKEIVLVNSTVNYYNEILEIVENLADPIVYTPIKLATYNSTNQPQIFKLIFNYMKKKGLEFVNGSKHNFTITFSAMCNQFGISEAECYYKLIELSSVSEYTQSKVEDIYKRYSFQYNTKKLFKSDKYKLV
jgi:hypothetical protein